MNAGKWLGCAVVLVGMQAVPLAAASRANTDAEAQYLYEITKFVRWPAPPGNGVRDICIAGRDSALETLKNLVAGETRAGLHLSVHAVEKVEDLPDCDLLFLDSQMKNFDAMLTAVSGKPILTVSDAPNFLEHGGMMQFMEVEGRVRFAVNLTPVTQSKLVLSSDLLKVAASVTGATGEGGGS